MIHLALCVHTIVRAGGSRLRIPLTTACALVLLSTSVGHVYLGGIWALILYQLLLGAVSPCKRLKSTLRYIGIAQREHSINTTPI